MENVKDHSKTSISVMWCGNAAGDCLPPMVVYKAQNIYESWVKGGHKGTVYQCTKSGWFDSNTFEQWFMEVVLEYVRKNPGRYVLFGDNLASHFNVDVVRVAEENDIHFVMLPPNSTHILQPLDVAVFSSLKQSWRVILDEWKREVRTEGAFNKQFFPLLLKRLINSQESCMQKNLQSGFRACGIHPLQRSEPLSKLPSTTSLNVSESNSSLNETLIGLLKNNRGCGEKKRQRRGKKIAQPGEVLSSAKFDCASTPETSGAKRSKRTRTEEIWTCSSCSEDWKGEDDDGNRWIVCDMCDKQYHLQCSGITYDEEDYYEIDIENELFLCEECE